MLPLGGDAAGKTVLKLRAKIVCGDEALSEFVNTNPIEFLKAIEATYIVEDDDEGLEEFQAATSAEVRRAVEDLITRDGFVVFDELLRVARENEMDDTADKIVSFLQRMRH